MTGASLRDSGSARILVVDDSDMNLRLMRRILGSAGYEHLMTSSDASDVPSMVQQFQPDLILLDLHMPGKDGFEVLKDLEPALNASFLPVLMLTGDLSPDVKRLALSLGAKDFLAKPFDTAEIVLRIHNLLETRLLYVDMESRVRRRTRELEQSQVEILERLARAAELRDDDTGRHTQRVGELSARLADAAGMPSAQVHLMRMAARLHDLGKIGIPDSILRKPGRLTGEEMDVIRSHTTIGAQMLSGGKSDLILMAERIAYSHHEWWNGEGYPRRLSEHSIPIEARIVGLADFFDAVSHARPYRNAWPLDRVLDEVRELAGTHFDARLVEVLLDTRCYRHISVTPPRGVAVVDAELDDAASQTLTRMFRVGAREA